MKTALLSLTVWLFMASAFPAEEPSRAHEQAGPAGRSAPPILTVAAQKQTAYPLWDGRESVAQYARRVNLPETQPLDLGNGVTLELVLIPAGKFVMGTPEPKPVNEGAFRGKIVTGLAVLAAGGGILLVLIGFAILRAIRERRRFQYSLRRLIAMTFAAGLCVLGGMHWWHTQRYLAEARAEFSAARARFKDAHANEKPAHEVTVTEPFYMGKYEVTQEQYQQIMGANPSHFNGPNLPVEMVSWDDAKEFCGKARGFPSRDRDGAVEPASEAGGSELRLPTDAEWEYACRAGTTTAYYFGDSEADFARVGWIWPNSGGSTHPVGQKEPNAWGLCDMHGNVWEWCEDWYEEGSTCAATDPKGPATGSLRILRGGSWYNNAYICRSALRGTYKPDIRLVSFGFRVVRAGPP